MAITVTGSVGASVDATLIDSAGPLANKPVAVGFSIKSIFQASGTAADQVDKCYAKTLSFTASTAQNLDLTSLTDIYGNAVSFARVRSILIKPKGTTDAATLTLAPHATNGWTNFLGASSALKLGMATSTNDAGFCASSPNTTGWAVSGSNKVLVLTPSAHAFDVDIEILGASA